ncbi:MAG: site-specific integrase [Candidatus Binatia bacterium]
MQRPKPDPFSEEERDQILGYLKEKAPFKDYAFVFSQFWTGMRPGEAVALRLRDIDLRSSRAEITKSRHLGEENAPKTPGSVRTVSLLPNVVEVWRLLIPLHGKETDYLFTDASGNPLDLENWSGRQWWYRALKVKDIRPRKFYATRHTYISMALSHGVNIKWIAEQCGTSVEMIEKNYGRFIRNDGDEPLRQLLAAKVELAGAQENTQTEVETETFTETFLEEASNVAGLLVVPTGIEPVLPT